MLYTVPTKRTVDLFDELHGRKVERIAAPDADGIPVRFDTLDSLPVPALAAEVTARLRANSEHRRQYRKPVAGDRRNASHLRKPVVCVDTGDFYESLHVAGQAYGVAGKRIGRAIARNGETMGLRWRWATQAEEKTRLPSPSAPVREQEAA